MQFLNIYGTGLAIILVLMIAFWVISLVLKNSSIVDIFWGTGFVIAAWVYFFLSSEGFIWRKVLIASLVTIWGLRLSIHILLRNWGKPEDFRYQKWRKEAGTRWWWQSYFKVFFLQGLLLWIISAPLLAAQWKGLPAALTILDILGIGIWMIGFFFEAVGDAQLTRFRSNPQNKGKVLDSGVWRFTRHPNYFGDATQWWAYFIIALAAGDWWAIFSPIIMTLLLLKVSGVALLEKSMETRPGYKEYVQKTSPFIPWFPKK